MHFTWDVSFGQLLTVGSIVAIGLRFHRDWVILSERVAKMWVDYEAKHGELERRTHARTAKG